MREHGPLFSNVGRLSCRLWFLLCRFEHQVLIVEAEANRRYKGRSEGADELEVHAD